MFKGKSCGPPPRAMVDMYEEKKKKMEEELTKEFEYKRKELELNVRSEKLQLKEEILNLREECAKQIAEYEHGFHQGKEDKRTILAALDGEIKAKGALLSELLGEKDRTISILTDTLKSIVQCNCSDNVVLAKSPDSKNQCSDG